MQSSTGKKYWTSDRIMWLIIGLGITAVIVLLIRYLSDVLLPFFVACFIAYILQPIVDFNQRILHMKSRTVPSLLTLIDVLALIVGIAYLFVPSVLSELDTLGNIIKEVSSGKRALPPLYAGVIDIVNRYFNPDALKDMLNGSHIDTLLSKGSSILEESFDMLFHILAWLLTLIYVIFIMIDYPQICRGFKLIIPHKYRPSVMPVVYEVAHSTNRYFRGQGLVALCAMVFYCTGFSLAGLPLAVPMGLLVGILYMIPYFQYVTIIPVVAIALIYSMGGTVDLVTLLGKCGLVYLVSQCTCDYIITPHVMGREMGLNPAVILLSLSVWGSLLGIIGMIIALPVSAIIMTYYERYISEPQTRTESASGTPAGHSPEKGSNN